MSAQSRERILLQARLVRDKRELRDALQGFAHAARGVVDLRKQIAARPLVWLAGALALGLGLGARR